MEKQDSNWQPRFPSFDGTAIHYEVRGEGNPVVLLHGFIVDGSSWESAPLYQTLLRHGFKVLTVDLRGNGRSDRLTVRRGSRLAEAVVAAASTGRDLT